MLTVKCPNCRQMLNMPEQYAGRSGTCNKCGGHITVPHTESEDHKVASLQDGVKVSQHETKSAAVTKNIPTGLLYTITSQCPQCEHVEHFGYDCGGRTVHCACGAKFVLPERPPMDEQEFLRRANEQARKRLFDQSDYAKFCVARQQAEQLAKERRPFYWHHDAGGLPYKGWGTTARCGVYTWRDGTVSVVVDRAILYGPKVPFILTDLTSRGKDLYLSVFNDDKEDFEASDFKETTNKALQSPLTLWQRIRAIISGHVSK